MPRKYRIVVSGRPNHVIQRGNRRGLYLELASLFKTPQKAFWVAAKPLYILPEKWNCDFWQ